MEELGRRKLADSAAEGVCSCAAVAVDRGTGRVPDLDPCELTAASTNSTAPSYSTRLDWTISGLVVAMFGGRSGGKPQDAGKLAGAQTDALSFISPF